MSEWWTRLPDALLRRATLVARVRYGRPPDPLAGVHVDDPEVLRLLAELDGDADLDGTAELVASVLDASRPAIEAARSAFAAGIDGDDVFCEIARTAQLAEPEAEVLALLSAIELDPRRQRLVAYVNDNVNQPAATPALLDDLFGDGSAFVAPGAALSRAGLVDVDVAAPWATAPVRAARVLVWALNGVDARDDQLPPGARILDLEPADGRGARDEPVLLLVSGGDRRSRADIAFAHLGTRRAVVASSPASDAWVALIRQATVARATVLVELDNIPDVVVRDAVERATHLDVVLSSQREIPAHALPDRPFTELQAPDVEAGVDPDSGHRLGPEQHALMEAFLPSVAGDVDMAVRRLASGLLDGLAVRVRPRRIWEDLVLPDEQIRELRDLADRYRYRSVVHDEWGVPAVPSRGVVALFAGPSGTGKTMAAEVLAGDLGLDLYKIDLSMVVSKYIGETEKQLERIFQAATAGNLVLFFDEADALFGKRSEVRDAHDRYANIETSYLLQRIETYDGFVVLATNLQANMDVAFLRRVHAHLRFEIPEPPERKRIWQACLPADVPVDDVDFDALAAIDLSGGSIRAAALAAMFLAAADGAGRIDSSHIDRGVERELRKMGRLAQPLSAQ